MGAIADLFDVPAVSRIVTPYASRALRAQQRGSYRHPRGRSHQFSDGLIAQSSIEHIEAVAESLAAIVRGRNPSDGWPVLGDRTSVDEVGLTLRGRARTLVSSLKVGSRATSRGLHLATFAPCARYLGQEGCAEGQLYSCSRTRSRGSGCGGPGRCLTREGVEV
jgi:hypothetical protein